MPHRLALILIPAFCLAGGMALILLLGLFGVEPAHPGTLQVSLIIIAVFALLSAIAIAGRDLPEPEPDAVTARQTNFLWPRRILELILLIAFYLILFAPSQLDQLGGEPLAKWLGWTRSVQDALLNLPPELTMLVPLLTAGLAIRAFARNRKTPT